MTSYYTFAFPPQPWNVLFTIIAFSCSLKTCTQFIPHISYIECLNINYIKHYVTYYISMVFCNVHCTASIQLFPTCYDVQYAYGVKAIHKSHSRIHNQIDMCTCEVSLYKSTSTCHTTVGPQCLSCSLNCLCRYFTKRNLSNELVLGQSGTDGVYCSGCLG